MAEEAAPENIELLQLDEKTRRKIGADEFIRQIEKTSGRKLKNQNLGQSG